MAPSFQLPMKNKEAADGPATQLEPSSGVATDPFIIASFRAEGELTEGIGLITSYIWEGNGGPEFTPVRAQVKATVFIVDCIGVVRYTSQNPSHLIFPPLKPGSCLSISLSAKRSVRADVKCILFNCIIRKSKHVRQSLVDRGDFVGLCFYFVLLICRFGSKFTVLLPPLPRCWDCKHVLPYLAQSPQFLIFFPPWYVALPGLELTTPVLNLVPILRQAQQT